MVRVIVHAVILEIIRYKEWGFASYNIDVYIIGTVYNILYYFLNIIGFRKYMTVIMTGYGKLEHVSRNHC